MTVYEEEEGLQFSEEIEGLSCASPIRTYLDLMETPLRGEDAAKHLEETIFLPRWA
ncbi:hypothetical protein BH11ARM2_BH11ARM2_10940 [soil metagenome]